MTQLKLLAAEAVRPKLDIETRLQISVAVDCYIRNEQLYNDARERFDESCSQLRNAISPNMRLVLRRDWKNYLLTTDTAGDFEIEEIESI